MIKITKLNQYGKPIEAHCPKHGHVEIISLPTQGSGSLKRIARAKAAGGKVNYGNSPKKGELSCGEIKDIMFKCVNEMFKIVREAKDVNVNDYFFIKDNV